MLFSLSESNHPTDSCLFYESCLFSVYFITSLLLFTSVAEPFPHVLLHYLAAHCSFLAFLKNRYSFSFSLLLSLPHHLIWASDWLLLLQLWIGKCQVYRLLPSLQCKHIVLQSCIISPAVGLYLWFKPMEISSIWLEKCTPRIKMQHCMHALKLPHKPGLSAKVYWSVKLWPGKEISLSVPQ